MVLTPGTRRTPTAKADFSKIGASARDVYRKLAWAILRGRAALQTAYKIHYASPSSQSLRNRLRSTSNLGRSSPPFVAPNVHEMVVERVRDEYGRWFP